jgi:uncharacterized protein (TIGR03067 family)
MRRLVLAAILMTSVGLSAQTDAKRELDKLQGTWVVTAATGDEIPAGAHVGLVVTNDKYQSVKNGKVDEAGRLVLNPATSPVSIDLVIADGVYAGKTQLGLVESSGDTLKMALAAPGQTTRPASLATDTFTLTKIKPLTKEFQGSWEGAIDASGRTLRLVIRLTNGADGLPSGTIVSVDQGGDEGPISAIVVSGARLKLIIPAIRGNYDGELKDGVLVGTWTQGRRSTPLTLKRSPGTPGTTGTTGTTGTR